MVHAMHLAKQNCPSSLHWDLYGIWSCHDQYLRYADLWSAESFWVTVSHSVQLEEFLLRPARPTKKITAWVKRFHLTCNSNQMRVKRKAVPKLIIESGSIDLQSSVLYPISHSFKSVFGLMSIWARATPLIIVRVTSKIVIWYRNNWMAMATSASIYELWA